jgi:hypothetical protein
VGINYKYKKSKDEGRKQDGKSLGNPHEKSHGKSPLRGDKSWDFSGTFFKGKAKEGPLGNPRLIPKKMFFGDLPRGWFDPRAAGISHPLFGGSKGDFLQVKSFEERSYQKRMRKRTSFACPFNVSFFPHSFFPGKSPLDPMGNPRCAGMV